MPISDATCNSSIAVMNPIDPLKNALMLGDIAILRATFIDENIAQLKNNIICDGISLQKEIKELARKRIDTNKDMHVVPFKELKDGFGPYHNLTTNNSLIPHTFTLQSNDSACNNSRRTHPSALGHETKDSIIVERTYIDELNNLEDPLQPFKAHSKKIWRSYLGSFVTRVY